MKQNAKKDIIQQWEQLICEHIQDYNPYKLDKKLAKMLELFAPGDYYFYVVNFHNLKMEYAHPGTEKILGISPNDFTTERFLDHFSESEIQKFKEKEAYVADFLFNFLEPAELPYYKVCYFLEVTSSNGVKKKLLHQATTLSVTKTGKIEHVLGVHTDVSHFQFQLSDTVSFIHLNGGTSYYNCNYKSGKFDSIENSEKSTTTKDLTNREVQILKLITAGNSSSQIAQKLGISKHTVDTYRRKIIKKTGSRNVAEVVQKFILQ